MKTFGTAMWAATVLMWANIGAMADEAPPVPKPKAVTAPLKVVKAKGEVLKIQIPAKYLPGAADKQAGGALGSTQTVVAGVAMACAAVSGLFVMRRQGRMAGAAVAGAVCVAGMIGVAMADIPVRDLPPPAEAKPRIVVEVIDKGGDVILTIGADQAKHFK